ncbi:MAG: hypothetical protein ACJ70Z_08735 [Nitrososphaera sp.]
MGDVIYTFALYNRLKGTSIPLDDAIIQIWQSVLAVSFDIAADPDSIIMDKILPVLKQRKLTEESVKVDWIEKEHMKSDLLLRTPKRNFAISLI